MNQSYIRLNEILFEERLQAAEQARRWRATGQPAASPIERMRSALSAALSGLRPAAQAPASRARHFSR